MKPSGPRNKTPKDRFAGIATEETEPDPKESIPAQVNRGVFFRRPLVDFPVWRLSLFLVRAKSNYFFGKAV